MEIVHSEDGHDDVIARHGPGGFTGELGLLSGARSQLTARVAEAGRVLEVTPADLRRLLDRETALARTIVDALLARRSIMRSGGGARTLQTWRAGRWCWRPARATGGQRSTGGRASKAPLERVDPLGFNGASPVACSGLFAFVGAEAATAWLPDDIALDHHGFVLTDRDVALAQGAAGPLAFKTSARGIFAAGDVRPGSSKRVAAAVGEGSSAVRSVHRRLQTRS